jgi:hypothetical protein
MEAIPEVLTLKSPYYELDARSRSPVSVTLEVAIPNDAEPWETLDLYSWSGEEWTWLGATLDTEREVLVAQFAEPPASVAVMQTSPVVPAIGTVHDSHPEGEAAEPLTEVLLSGLYLGTDGTLLGDVPAVAEDSNPEPVLLVRNVPPGQPLSRAPLDDLLTSEELQAEHVESIAQAAISAQASGVTLDYRGVVTEQRTAFSNFVTALADALHTYNVRLLVAIPAPTQSESGWETDGYDWAALGNVADGLLLPLPEDPAAYAEGGSVQELLDWAVSQVNRYKLRAWLSSLCVDATTQEVQRVSLEQALAPFGQVEATEQADLVPGEEVAFTLAGQVTSLQREEQAGTYAIHYRDEEGTQHTVWLGTPTFLARKLDWALRYHLSGVIVEDVLSEGNLTGIVDALESYRAAADQGQQAELEVTWTVAGPEPQEERVTLSQPDFRWTVPETPGRYTVAAAIAGVERGTVALTVPTPTPEPTATPTSTLSIGGDDVSADADTCLRASFVADVTIPDGTQMEKGEEFVKTWRLSNSGTCDWPEDTQLVLISSDMGGEESVEVGAVEAGETVEISVNLVAPDADGNFDGMWALKVGDQELQRVTAVIRCGEVSQATGPGTGTTNPGPISGSFELGGHVRDMSLPYADTMHYAGMNWAKVQVHYGQDASGLIAAAHSRGFKIQLSALGSPDMVTQSGFEQDFANWVASLAAQGADAIEVWNEPNIEREWQIGHISPQAYTDLLCTSYQAIKGANPNALVISAAPAPTGYFGGCSANGCDDHPWMAGLAAAGAANCMDYIGAHHNSGATSPSARSGHPAGGTHHSWYFLPQTELYYSIFGGSRQLFYTEMGYASQEGVPTFSDQFGWARDIDNAEQAAWLAEAVRLGSNTGMVRCIIVWNIDFTRYGYDPQDGYAIIRPGGACPACDTLHATLGTR